MLGGVARRQSGTHVVRVPLVVIEAQNVTDDVLAQVRSSDGSVLGSPLLRFRAASSDGLQNADGVLLVDGADGLWAVSRVAEVRDDGFPGLIAVATPPVSEDRLIEGYQAGALVWASLPLHAALFPAQAAALIRRLVGDAADSEVAVTVDHDDRTVWIGDDSVKLPPVGFALFVFLLAHRGTWLSPKAIADHLFPAGSRPDFSLVRVHVKRVRDALGPDRAWLLESREGLGYRINLRCDSTARLRLRPHGRYRPR